MKLLSIEIQGFGPYARNTVIDLTTPSPIAVVGTFGSGKTIAVECIGYALTGQFCWYRGSASDLVTIGNTEDARVMLQLMHGESTIAIERIVRPTARTQKCFVYQSGEKISGPKVTDAQAWIDANLDINPDTFFATRFLSQNKYGDLCGMPGEGSLAQKRREVFASLLGSAQLEKYLNQIIKAAQDTADRLQYLAGKTSDIDDLRTQHKEKCEAITASNHAVREQEHQRDIMAKQVEQAKQRLEELNKNIEAARAIIAQHEKLHESIELVQEQINRLLDDKRRADDIIADADSLKEEQSSIDYAAKELAELRDEHAKLEQSKRDYDEQIKRMEEQNQRIDQQRRDLNGMIESRRDRIKGHDEESKYLAEAVAKSEDPAKLEQERDEVSRQGEDIAKQYQQIEESNREIEKTNQGIALVRVKIDNQISGISARINDLKAKFADRPVTPFGEQCKPCPLMVEFFEIPDEIEKLQLEYTELANQKAALPEPKKIVDTAEIVKQRDDLRLQWTQLTERIGHARKTDANRESIERIAEAIKTIQGELVKLEKQVAELPEAKDCAEWAHTIRFAQVQSEIKRLEPIAARKEIVTYKISQVESARKSLTDDILPKVKDLTGQLEAKNNAIQATQKQHEDALKATQVDTVQIKDSIAQIESNLKTHTANLNSVVAQLEGIKTLRDDLARRIESAEQFMAELREKSAELDALKALREIFGPKGVSQLMIDQAAPQLEKIADDLFRKASQGRMRLRIATQRENRDGSLAEDFQILVRDQFGERDVTRFSGGQLHLIRVVFRLAVSLWISRLNGVTPDFMIMDEAFDNLGSEGSEQLLNLLNQLQDEFGLIIVVTHENSIASQLASKIDVHELLAANEPELEGVA